MFLQDVPGLWNLDMLDGRNDKKYEYGRSMGSGVRIYVLDTVRSLCVLLVAVEGANPFLLH